MKTSQSPVKVPKSFVYPVNGSVHNDITQIISRAMTTAGAKTFSA
jgi:hypothetical protein